MKKVLRYVVGAAILVASYGVYIHFSSNIGSSEEKIAGKSEGGTPLGRLSDGTFKECSTLSAWDDANSDFITITASNINKTGLYMRKGWVDRTQKTSKHTGRRTRQTTKQVPQFSNSSIFSIANREYMVPLYTVTLADGSVIGAVIEPKYVSKLKSEEKITLPIGQKIKLSTDWQRLFAGESFGKLNIKSVYYALDNEWHAENASMVKIKAIVFAALTFILLVVVAYFGLNRLFRGQSEK